MALTGGPNTPEGKAIAPSNSLAHGIFAESPVIPIIEDPAAWDRHRDALIHALNPADAFEMMLAERIASLDWRLSRVVRYERESLAHRQREIHIRPLHDGRDIWISEREAISSAHLIPGERTLAKIQKYEAHLSRQLRTAYHDLEARQLRRKAAARVWAPDGDRVESKPGLLPAGGANAG